MRRKLSVLLLAALSVVGLATPSSAQPPVPPPPDPNTAYLIANYGLPRCVDIPGFGAGQVDGPVTQWTCNSQGDNQKFYFEQRSVDGRGRPLYWIRNATDGLCLDLPAFDTVPPATKVTEYHCRDNDNQYWYMDPQFSRHQSVWYYWLREAKTDMCLDIPGIADAPLDVQLEIYPCQSGDDHEWNLVRTSS